MSVIYLSLIMILIFLIISYCIFNVVKYHVNRILLEKTDYMQRLIDGFNATNNEFYKTNLKNTVKYKDDLNEVKLNLDNLTNFEFYRMRFFKWDFKSLSGKYFNSFYDKFVIDKYKCLFILVVRNLSNRLEMVKIQPDLDGFKIQTIDDDEYLESDDIKYFCVVSFFEEPWLDKRWKDAVDRREAASQLPFL